MKVGKDPLITCKNYDYFVNCLLDVKTEVGGQDGVFDEVDDVSVVL
jgi:hypothetical protein